MMNNQLLTTPSPCVKVCILDPITNLCQGCYRTLEEITNWKTYDNCKKRTVISQIAFRKQELTS